MARWDPGTQQRLVQAALDLFTEQGYDEVTIAQIAERAGITRRTYFRYFPDKREVLFAGSERLPAAIHQAVLAAPGDSPMCVTVAALADVGSLLVEHVVRAAQRRAVIDASRELAERERTKLAVVTAAIRGALVQRMVEPGTAKVVAQVATIVFENAFDEWLDTRERKDFASCLHAATDSLRHALA